MLQYATSGSWGRVIEDTDLITLEEAEALWNKYYPDCIRKLEAGDKPQMCIWTDRKSNIDYSTVHKEIDFRDDYRIENDEYYKLTKERIR